MFKIFRRLLFILLIAVIVWQQWHIYTLKNDLKDTAAKVSDKDNGLTGSLDKAQHYTQEARKFIEEGKIKEAQKSLDKAEEGTKNASKTAKDILHSTGKVIGNTKDHVVNAIEKAGGDISKDVDKKKK